MNHRANPGKTLLLVFLVSLSDATGYCFSARILPGNPVGGEALYVAVTGSSHSTYEIRYDSAAYKPYPAGDGVYGLFLPVEIEASGDQTVTVKQKFWGIGIRKRYVHVSVEPRKLVTVVLREKDETMRDKQPFVDEQQKLVLEKLNVRSSSRDWDSGFIMPVELSGASNFAQHRKGSKYDYFHRGVDISAKKGVPVGASNDGTVVLAYENMNVYGNMLVIDHGQGVVTCYFHMNRLLKSAGDRVKKGDRIGEVGSTGWATGPHLHFGVYIQGKAIDPVWWTAFSAAIREQH